MKKRILFLSSANLSTNPRIYKEIRLAESLGFEPVFVGFKLGNWSDADDDRLARELTHTKRVYLDATRAQFFKWLYFSLAERLCRILWTFSRRSVYISSAAHSKRAISLYHAVNELKGPFALVIGHTLATLYPGYHASRRHKCGFAFDIEDYHPGEAAHVDPANERRRRELLMRKLLPRATYVTTAAPLITQETKKLCRLQPDAIFTVINSFERAQFITPMDTRSSKLRLVWFSQNITAGRGLELLIDSWNELQPYCSLTLVGLPDAAFVQAAIAQREGIVVKGPVTQADLHKLLAEFDVGLALDLSAADLNRQLALTNKIIAYAQAGLYIVATDTPAQQLFITENPFTGEVCGQEAASLTETVKGVAARMQTIREEKMMRYEKAKQLSWDVESAKLRNKWLEVTA